MVSHCFRLLDAGLQERTITPYLYFIDNHRNDSVRVLFSNNKWPFSKGMTLVLWINALGQSNCRILWLRTEDGNEMAIKVENGVIIVSCTSKGKTKNTQKEKIVRLRSVNFLQTQQI